MITYHKPKSIIQWLQIYRLYRSAFPITERKPFSIIVNMQRKGKTDVWYCSDNSRFIGLATTINGPEAVLLDYFAVSPNCRSSGYGSQMLQALIKHYHPRGVFGEIESAILPGPDLDIRRRRKRFYLDNGMEEMGLTVELFGVPMEVIGIGCSFDFDAYRRFYYDNYGPWAAEHIFPAESLSE